MLLDILVVKFLSRYLSKPIYVFGGIGFAFFFLALIAIIWAIVLKFAYSVSFIQTPLPLFGSVCFFLGFICILLGLLAEIMSRTYFESQSRRDYLVRETINLPGSQEKDQ